MSISHSRRRHRHRPKMSSLMRSLIEITYAINRFKQSKDDNFVDFLEKDPKWKGTVHRPKQKLSGLVDSFTPEQLKEIEFHEEYLASQGINVFLAD